MRRKLDVHEPMIKHNPANAYLLSIIGDKEDEKAWIMNNFVNIRYNPVTKYDDFYRNDMWYNCYHISENRFTKEFIEIFSCDPFECLKRMIDNGYYLYVFLNRRYIHNYGREKSDFWHNSLIYGYDTSDNCIFIADFFRDGSINFEQCTIEEYIKAYPYPNDKKEFYHYIWNRAIKKKENYEFKFSTDDLRTRLIDYVTSKKLNDTTYHSFDTNDTEEIEYFHVENGYDYAVGIACYDEFIKDLYSNELKYRPLHLLYEHKKVMCKRLEYLKRIGVISNITSLYDTCEEMMDECLMVRNFFLKNNVIKNTNSKNKDIIHSLENIKKKDIEFTLKLIEFLQ